MATQIPRPQQIQMMEIRVTDLEPYGPFIKLFAQVDKERVTYYEKLLHSLKNYFFDNKELDLKPSTAKDIEVGLLCVAKFEDGAYYRAKILSVDKLRLKHVVTVNFIDHGNNHDVNVSDIRLFSKLLKLLRTPHDTEKVTQLRDSPPLAEEFFVTSIATNAKDWDERILEHLKTHLTNNDLKCNVYTLEGKRCVKFLVPEFEPSNILHGVNQIIPVSLSNQEKVLREIHMKALRDKPVTNVNLPPPAILMQQPPPLRFPNLNQPPPGIRMASELNSQPPLAGMQQTRLMCGPGRPGSVRVSGPVGFKNPEFMTNDSHLSTKLAHQSITSIPSQFASEMLAPGISHPVYVTHVENGPHSFAIQLQEEATQLTKIMADLNSIEPMPISAPLNPGSVCLGRMSVNDCLCRTIVLGISGDQIKLNFVDYGHNATVHYTDVFQIPSQFMAYKTMSHRFALANISDVTFSELEKTAFTRLTYSSAERKLLVMKVTAMENPVRQYCELYVDGKNVKHLMKELVPTPVVALKYSPVSTPILGSQEKVLVSYVLNPGRFYVQLDKSHYQLTHTMQALKRHCQSASLISQQNLKVSEVCCAMYEDNIWYRAEILTLATDKALINFVDYGNQEEIKFSDLRVISPELVTGLKAQAICCCLKGYENRLEFDDEVANRLEEMILEKKLMMHVENALEQEEVLIVTLLDAQGEDIGAQLEPRQRPIMSTSHMNHATPPAALAAATEGWEGTATSNSREDRFSEGRGQRLSKGKRSPQSQEWIPNNRRDWQQQQQQPNNNKFYRDDYKKSWRSRDDKEGGGGRWNDNAKPREDKPWEKRDNRFNREDSNRGSSRFSRDEESGGGGRPNRDEDSGGRVNNREGGSRFNDVNRFGDKSSEERPARFGGNRFNDGNSEDRPPFRKREDDFGGGGYRGNKAQGDGSWRDKESSGWKDNTSNHSGETRQNDGFKRGGFNRDGPSSDRPSFKKPWERGTGDNNYQRSAPRSKSPKPDTVGGMPQSTIKVGVSEDAQVVFTTSPAEFYVQLQSSYDLLTQLMERIATACESGEVPDLSDVREKAGCLAKYSEDDTWYRAVVEEKSFDSAKVLFVDYGNQESVTFDKIKELPEDMTSLPVQAIKCRLFGVPESAETEAFSNLVDGKNLRTQFVAKDFTAKSFQVVLVDEETATNINTAMGANEQEIATTTSKEEEVECRASEHQGKPHNVYIFGDSHARDQAAHLNTSLKSAFNVRSVCCPGWPLNEVVEKAISRFGEFAALTRHDFIVVVGGSNDTSEAHQRILLDLYKKLFSGLSNTNIIVCETPFRFDEVEKNTEIATTNNMVAHLCSAFPHATFLPMINSMQRYHFTNHGLHMKQSGKRILSGLIANCIRKKLYHHYLNSMNSEDG